MCWTIKGLGSIACLSFRWKTETMQSHRLGFPRAVYLFSCAADVPFSIATQTHIRHQVFTKLQLPDLHTSHYHSDVCKT